MLDLLALPNRLLAVFLLVGIKLDEVLVTGMNIIKVFRSSFLNPLQASSIHDLLLNNLEKFLPSSAHHMCNGRLGLSLTKMCSYENNFVTEFKSRRDLIDAVTAGCFIPLWSGYLTCPIYQGEKHADGAYSNNMPKFELSAEERLAVLKGHFDCIKQVDVAPFSSEVAVSPQGESGSPILLLGTKYLINWNNVVRSIRAVFPFSLKTYEPFFLAGHRDMKDYVIRSNLIKCNKCYLDIKSNEKTVISTQQQQQDKKQNETCCLVCLKLLEKVDALKVPEELMKKVTG